jgi:hypothetical protein
MHEHERLTKHGCLTSNKERFTVSVGKSNVFFLIFTALLTVTDEGMSITNVKTASGNRLENTKKFE